MFANYFLSFIYYFSANQAEVTLACNVNFQGHEFDSQYLNSLVHCEIICKPGTGAYNARGFTNLGCSATRNCLGFKFIIYLVNI